MRRGAAAKAAQVAGDPLNAPLADGNDFALSDAELETVLDALAILRDVLHKERAALHLPARMVLRGAPPRTEKDELDEKLTRLAALFARAQRERLRRTFAAQDAAKTRSDDT